MTYLGPNAGGKGYFLLKSALDKIYLNNQITLNIFFQPTEISPYIKVHKRYDYSQLGEIFNKTDVLIAPSIWYETFGYTVLESLSYGVPVIVSGNVGAKDIIPMGGGIVIDNITSDKLKDEICKLNPTKLIAMNKSILDKAEIMTINQMCNQIMEKCYEQ